MNGYLSVMAKEMEQVKVRMLNHLQEMMEDRKAYGWPAVLLCATLGAWLSHME